MTQEKKILFLGEEHSPLINWLQKQGEQVIQTTEKISIQFVKEQKFFFLVSYGYRYIIRKDILDLFPEKAVNLHISYLPWNRGSDPNFWSFAEDTPKGVTIHYLDEGVDTGDIIVQKKVEFNLERETLATSYEKLQASIQDLFKKNWLNIRNSTCKKEKQVGEGSMHKAKDKEDLFRLLEDGWNTPVSVLRDICSKNKPFFEK